DTTVPHGWWSRWNPPGFCHPWLPMAVAKYWLRRQWTEPRFKKSRCLLVTWQDDTGRSNLHSFLWFSADCFMMASTSDFAWNWLCPSLYNAPPTHTSLSKSSLDNLPCES